MNEQVARNVVLVHAIETADTQRTVLSDDDRLYASRSARELAQWSAADRQSPLTLDHFLEQRSEQILKRLAERHSSFGAILKRQSLLPLLSILLPLVALVLGAAIDHIADPHRIDLLSAPLLLIVGWNMLVYLIILVWLFVPGTHKGWVGSDLMRQLSVGKIKLPRKLPDALVDAVRQYAIEWTALSWRLTHARLSRTIHLAAAAFATGAIASLYARGLLTEYAVGWESTFLEARQVHTVLSWLFVPALSVFPIDGFTPADIERLHFSQTPSHTGGAHWVHLYAATLLLLVILPRLLLAAFAGWRGARLSRRIAIDVQSPYYRRLAEQIGLGAGPTELRVLPYSFTLDEARDRGLVAIASQLFGERTRVMLRPPIPYGDDIDAALAESRNGTAEAAQTITAALFNLAATPEKENHGAFLDALKRRLPRGLLVLVDESTLLERSTGQVAETRLAERIALWRQFCGHHGMQLSVVNLLQPDKYRVEAAPATFNQDSR